MDPRFDRLERSNLRRYPVPQNFFPCDRDQSVLMPPYLRECLPPDRLVWFVIDSVKQLDLGTFSRRHRADGWDPAAYDPPHDGHAAALRVCDRHPSARDIGRRAVEDIACRVIRQPPVNHATIGRFIIRHRSPLSELS
jgi:hypothetical protein